MDGRRLGAWGQINRSINYNKLLTTESFKAHLAPAFALVDDLQRVFPPRRVLHAFPDHCKVPVSQRAAHLVALRYVGWNSWNLKDRGLSCDGEAGVGDDDTLRVEAVERRNQARLGSRSSDADVCHGP